MQPAAVVCVLSVMPARFVTIDRDTPLLLPPNLRDWVPADHLVHFILDAVDSLDLRQVRVNTRCEWRSKSAAGGARKYPTSQSMSEWP